MAFVHLHVHNEFSYLDGFGSAENYAKKAAELGMSHLALTNHGNIDGLIKFQKACAKEGISPILGCELYIVRNESVKEKGERRSHITVLVENEVGFNNLCRMLTIANLEGFYYKPRIGYQNFLQHCSGLIVLTGCAASFLRKDPGKQSMEFFHALHDKIGPNLYLEVMPHQLDEQAEQNLTCVNLVSQANGLKLVATNDCHYIEADDAPTQEILLAIQTKAKWKDADRFRFSIKGLHLRSEQEMADAFVEQNILSDDQINGAMDSTLEIADKCEFLIPKKTISLPMVPGMENGDPGELIWGIAEKNLLAMNFSTETTNAYFERLSTEWELIVKKGFAQYFLIVYELINWCKKNDIMVGPGRGSVGGSLLAFLMGITSVDPIKHDLLFSRFISDDRIDYPDIDMDFEDRKRDLVRKHLEDVYGKDHIASLSTFFTMKGRTTVRDVSRVFDLPLNEVDKFAKVINDSEDNGEESSVVAASKTTEEGQWFVKKYPEIVRHASSLEGTCRGTGQHAAAVLVSSEPLTEGTRCNLAMRSGSVVANWDMGDSEYVGLIKLDILGLNTLSVLHEAKRIIRSYPGKESFEFESIPLDDANVYREIAEGNNVGVFQLSTYTTTKYSKLIKPQNLSELSDTIALVRPGPADSGMTQLYIDRKHNKEKWPRKHPKYEAIVENTYGIIVYQEQVMDVIYKVAGLPYSTADKIRKVIGKKRDPKEFKPYEEAFVEGCLKERTFSEQEAREFWVALQSHARYSFNKSHSCAYAILGYWCAWCKLYFPTAFISASLTYGSDGKKEDVVIEAERLGLKICTPRVGISKAEKWEIRGNEIYAPFIEIKGIGEKTAMECESLGKREAKSSNKFFSRKSTIVSVENTSGKIGSLLNSIGAYGNPPSEDIGDYFNFPVRAYKPQEKIIPAFEMLCINTGECSTEDVSSLNIEKSKIKSSPIKQVSFEGYAKKISRCSECDLRKECSSPVPPSPGFFNIAIVGEAPGEQEDLKKKPLVGRSGDLLWSELSKRGIEREDIHVTNSCKCYPKESRTPSQIQIKTCFRWLNQEFLSIKPALILAFGNTGLYTFIGQEKGIVQKNGKTEWLSQFQCWICWCIHPAAVLRQPTLRPAFEDGIENFCKKIELLS